MQQRLSRLPQLHLLAWERVVKTTSVVTHKFKMAGDDAYSGAANADMPATQRMMDLLYESSCTWLKSTLNGPHDQ